VVRVGRGRHKQGSKEGRATLYFIYQDMSRLGDKAASDLVSEALRLAVRDAGRFKDFLAYVEDIRPTEKTKRILPNRTYVLPGEVAFVSIREVEAVLRQKLADEATHKRVKGHQSYEAPSFLYEDTCGLIIGSLPFLLEHADLYLERSGILRDKFVNIVKVLARIQERSTASTLQDSMVQVNLWEEQFYPGNFNALAERVFGRASRLSHDEFLARIAKRKPVSCS
jgi:hypothetical protein